MQLGFVSAILSELSLEQVFEYARQEGFACVEPMCWPVGGADRRYAGVTHIDVARLEQGEAQRVRAAIDKTGVRISGLGYYPNPLAGDAQQRQVVVEHLKNVIDGARVLGVGVVNTFIGRDPAQTVEAQWPLMRQVWTDLVAHAQRAGVKVGIEHCPMLFSDDEWPGGKNLAVSPAVWRKLFETFPGPTLGLNFDPSHLVWQMIDIPRAIREFAGRIVHVHAKDERVDRDRLYERGILGLGWHVPKLPGLGEVDWSAFFAALTDAGYNGPVCIEVEDRAYEGSLEDRKRALRQSKRFLEQFLA
jgi:sugar phosphate isomerase/epimerase